MPLVDIPEHALPPGQPQNYWMFNPAAMMRDLGLSPDPWQVEFLNMTYRRALLLCSRRSGKTTAVAIKALHHAMFASKDKPATVLILAPAGKQSDELLYHLHRFYDRLGKPVERNSDRKSQLDFANGSRIIPFTSNPDSVLGFTPTLVIIDEAARVEDKLFEAILPMRALGKCQLVALSTPNGKRGWFYDEYIDPARNWYRVRKTADDCPRIDRMVIEEDRISRGEAYVRQEYFCHFEVMEGLVYPEFESRIIDPRSFNLHRAWAGCDFGWNNPSAFVVVASDTDDVLYVVDEIYKSQMDDEQLALEAAELCQRWHVEKVWCDSANPQSISKLRRGGVPATEANKAVTDGIRMVGARLRTGRLWCFRTCSNIIRESGLYHYDPERRASTDDPVKEDDHSMDALRYCIMGIDRGKHPHGYLPPPPDKEEPAYVPNHGPDGDYRKPISQQRYSSLEHRRDLEWEQSEDARRLQREHIETMGWES